MATFAELVGYDIKPGEAGNDSFSLLSMLQGKTSKSPRTTHVHHFKSDIFAIRKGDWVLINNYTGYGLRTPSEYYLEKYKYTELTDKSKDYLLYNVKDDKAEYVDRASDHPELINDMRKLLEKYKKDGKSI